MRSGTNRYLLILERYWATLRILFSASFHAWPFLICAILDSRAFTSAMVNNIFALHFVERFFLDEKFVSSDLAKNQGIVVIYTIDFERYLNMKVLFVWVRIVFFSSTEGLAERERPWAERVAERA